MSIEDRESFLGRKHSWDGYAYTLWVFSLCLFVLRGLLAWGRGEEKLTTVSERTSQATLGKPEFSLLNLNANHSAVSLLSLEEKRGIDYIGGVCTVSLSSSLKPPNESGGACLWAGWKELAAAIGTGTLDALIILIISSWREVHANICGYFLRDNDPISADRGRFGRCLTCCVPFRAISCFHFVRTIQCCEEPWWGRGWGLGCPTLWYTHHAGY